MQLKLSLPVGAIARRFGVGKLALRYYHAPVGNLRNTVLEGGPIEQRRTRRGRLEMIDAARRLPPLQPPIGASEVEVSFLSGARYWYQTLFCAWSLQSWADAVVVPTIYDDGSLSGEMIAAVARVMPWARFVRRAEIEARLDALLPVDEFPNLRARRLEYPHLRKLTDIHLGRVGWTAVLDSDMLFFRRPNAFLEWAKSPERPCHLVDTERAYGYSPEIMRELAGFEEPERVNVGLTGLHSGTIDWRLLDDWCRAMLDREGPSYLQEQALTALLLAGRDCLRLPAGDYQVRPSLSEGRNPSAVLHHYVSHSKRSYYQWGWRRVLEGATKTAQT
jgi:hypothetical protein